LAELDGDDCGDEEPAGVAYSVVTSDWLADVVALALAARALGWGSILLLLGLVAEDVATRSPGVTGCVGLLIVWAALARGLFLSACAPDVSLCAVAAWLLDVATVLAVAVAAESLWRTTILSWW
jgi:hypothetical protein